MKILALLFLIGCASASFYDALDNAADEVVRDFMSGMEKAPPLRVYLDMDHDEIDQIEDDIKTELGKQMKEHLDTLMEKMKEAVDHGRKVKEETMEKMHQLLEKLHDMKIEVGEKAKDAFKKLKDKIKDHVSNVWDKIKEFFETRSKRATDEVEVALKEFDLKTFLENIKEMLKEKINFDKIKETMKELLQKKTELWQRIKDILKEKGEKGLRELMDRLVGEKEISTRSLAEYWEKIKEHFKNMKDLLKEKHMKFWEWVKDTTKKGIDHTKSKLENIKEIAKEIHLHLKELKEDVALEALEFLRPYKDDFLAIFEELKEHVKKLTTKEE